MIRFFVWLVVVGCGEGAVGDSAAPVLESCELAASSQTCPSCSDGALTCEFEGSSVTTESCGECQVRAALYQDLCDAGELATADEIVARTACFP